KKLRRISRSESAWRSSRPPRTAEPILARPPVKHGRYYLRFKTAGLRIPFPKRCRFQCTPLRSLVNPEMLISSKCPKQDLFSIITRALDHDSLRRLGDLPWAKTDLVFTASLQGEAQILRGSPSHRACLQLDRTLLARPSYTSHPGS